MPCRFHLLVVIGLVTMSLVAAGAETAPQTRQLWDCESTKGTKGLTLEQKDVKQGRAAIRWRDHSKVPGFTVPGAPQDWSGFNLLRLWVHNAKPVPTRFMIIVCLGKPADRRE